MRVTRKIIAARCNQLQAQLDAQGNPGRIKLKAMLAEATKTIESRDQQIVSLNKKIEEMDLKINELNAKVKDLEEQVAA
jgi:peptidoglycan hydrolase CwlO-like protein